MGKVKGFFRDVWRNKMFLIMLIPGVVWYILFSYVPMFGVIIAFKDFDYGKGIFGSDWSGLHNFEFLFKSNDAFIILRNTICYNLVWIPLAVACAVIMAIIFDALAKRKVTPWTKVTQTMSMMPHFISWIVVSYFVTGLLDYDKGMVNSLLKSLGMDPINWYTDTSKWPFILTICTLWKGVGYNSIVYYSTIRGFSPEYYEAAWLDGANWYKQTRYITLPLLKPTLTVLLTLNIASILSSDFGLFYFIPKNSGLLYSVTSTLDTYVYNGMTQGGDFGMTGAVGFVKSVVGFILILITNAIVRKRSPENALF